jgi:hypothetical protein
VIYEVKIAVFAIQNCLPKGLGLQCREFTVFILFMLLLSFTEFTVVVVGWNAGRVFYGVEKGSVHAVEHRSDLFS